MAFHQDSPKQSRAVGPFLKKKKRKRKRKKRKRKQQKKTDKKKKKKACRMFPQFRSMGPLPAA